MFFPLVACSYIICRVNNTLEVLLPDSEIVSHVLEREAVSAFSRMWLRLLYYNVVLFKEENHLNNMKSKQKN